MYQKLQNDPNNINLSNAYKECKKQIKTGYSKSMINNNKNSSKAIWKRVNNICNKPEPKAIISKIRLTDGNIIENKQQIANAFNQHCSDLRQTYANKINDSPEGFAENNIEIENTMYLYPTNETSPESYQRTKI